MFCFVFWRCDMEEHFILRVPQSVAERLERILNEDPDAAADGSLDLAFQGQHLNLHFRVYTLCTVCAYAMSVIEDRAELPFFLR